MELLLFISIGMIVFAYFGYPLSMYLLSKYRGNPHVTDYNYARGATYIIAAANEEKRILEKLENLKDHCLPIGATNADEIIIALDAPTDNTTQIIYNWRKANPYYNVVVVELSQKSGKEAAQKRALEYATKDIVVFTDVTTMLTTVSVHSLLNNFADMNVGCVDGMSVTYREDGEKSNEGIYLKYENKIRQWESTVGSVVTNGGCLFAVRRKLLDDFSDCLSSDFRTALTTVRQGYRAVFDPNAEAKFLDIKDESKEFGRKCRTVIRGLNTFLHDLDLLNPFKYGLFSYQLFCHKMLKWLVPFFMVTAYLSAFIGTVNTTNVIFPILLGLQSVFYYIALFEYYAKTGNPIFKIVSFFTMANVAIFAAWIAYLKGERMVTWEATKR